MSAERWMGVMNGEGNTLQDAMLAARRAAGMTQSDLARKAGCQQSAISMFESGRPDCLSGEKIQAIARILGVDLSRLPAGQAGDAGVGGVLKYCPDALCPSNIPYVVGRRLCHSPTLVLASAGTASRCRHCGELLESGCPGSDCQASVSPGAFCESCGTPYIVSGIELGDDAEAWVARWKKNVEILRGSMRPHWIEGPGAVRPARPRSGRERESGKP